MSSLAGISDPASGSAQTTCGFVGQPSRLAAGRVGNSRLRTQNSQLKTQNCLPLSGLKTFR